MISICPNCQHESELFLTAPEEREARQKGWYVSCPKCMAGYIEKFEINEEEEAAENESA